jgi:hypothetical protein
VKDGHHCRVSGLLEQSSGADAFQPSLRCGFQARLTAGVDMIPEVKGGQQIF